MAEGFLAMLGYAPLRERNDIGSQLCKVYNKWGMEIYQFLIYQSDAKSFHSGFFSLIKSIFRERRQLFNSFSLSIAAHTLLVDS